MKKIILILMSILVLFVPVSSYAAELSNDSMILEWHTTKVWKNEGELYATGILVNRRKDLTITKLNEFTMNFIFTREDGSKYMFSGKPKKIPACKINANSNKKLTLNFGLFDDSWKTWNTSSDYIFSYVHGSRW